MSAKPQNSLLSVSNSPSVTFLVYHFLSLLIFISLSQYLNQAQLRYNQPQWEMLTAHLGVLRFIFLRISHLNVYFNLFRNILVLDCIFSPAPSLSFYLTLSFCWFLILLFGQSTFTNTRSYNREDSLPTVPQTLYYHLQQETLVQDQACRDSDLNRQDATGAARVFFTLMSIFKMPLNLRILILEIERVPSSQ